MYLIKCISRLAQVTVNGTAPLCLQRSAPALLSPAHKLKSGTSIGAYRPFSSTSNVEDDRLNVVMDMDECMIHSLILNPMTGGIAVPQTAESVDHFRKDLDALSKYIATMPDGDRVLVLQRPHLMRFLEKIASKYRVSVYTAGTQEYADAVLNALDPSGDLFTGGRFYRDSCLVHSRLHLKDIRICTGNATKSTAGTTPAPIISRKPTPSLEEQESDHESLARVVLVDNSSISMVLQPSNGIPVQAWYHDSKDDAFDRHILNVLERLEDQEDVRPVLQSMFKDDSTMQEARRIRDILFEQDSAASAPIQAKHDLDTSTPNFSRDRGREKDPEGN